MTWKEAYKIMQDGKKIRKATWKPYDYIYLKEGVLLNDLDENQLANGINTNGNNWMIWGYAK